MVVLKYCIILKKYKRNVSVPSSEKIENRTHINIWNIHDMEVVDIITLVVANIKLTYAETRLNVLKLIYM